MKVTVTRSPDAQCTLQVEIEAAVFMESYEQHLRKASRNVVVPGFRKGKAPPRMAERHLSRAALIEETLKEIAPPAFQRALEEEMLIPLSEPTMELVQMEKDKDLIIKYGFEVRPQVEISDYLGMHIVQEKPVVKDEDVEKTLQRMQENAAKMVTEEEERALSHGDFATVDFQAFLDDRPLHQGSGENVFAIIDDANFLPGFVEQVAGLKKGDEKDFSVKVPEDHPSKLAGKEVRIHFKLREIKKKVVPELNDEFAREVSSWSTLQELREQTKKRLEEAVDVEARTFVEAKIMENLLQKVDVSVSGNLLALEVNSLLQELERSLAASGMTVQAFLGARNISMEELRRELGPKAERMAKIKIALDAVARQEKIDLKPQDIEEEFARMASLTGMSAEEIKKQMEEQGALLPLKENLLRKKVVNFIVGNSTVEYCIPAPEAETPPEVSEQAEPAAKEESA